MVECMMLSRDRRVFKLAFVDKDMSLLLLFFPGRSWSRDGKILVITSTWVVVGAQVKRLGQESHILPQLLKQRKVDSFVPRPW